jgi:UDP-N-acetyl-D-galactosamine dehydrogenase
MISEQLKNKEAKLAVVGLGYVGLPVAIYFAKKISVIGFDINAQRVELLKQKNDPNKELAQHEFEQCDITFTNDPEDLKQASFYIVCVPTPVDEHNVPDLRLLKKACGIVGEVISKGDYVVFESTVYPGCTEEDCVPCIEKVSGLKSVEDFKFGYSPERINPGDKEHSLFNIIKVVSGCDDTSAEEIAKVYSMVVEAGIHKTSSIKVAEAAKVIENTQRDLNIALMNELSIIFDKIGINTYEVLEAAATKWNFLPFKPGLVGGHCIGVDPYYLTYKASEIGFNSRVITAGRYVNDTMGNYIAKKIIQHIIKHSDNVKEAKVLIMGATFKENVSDIRNSKVADIVKVLQDYYLNIDVIDPHALSNEWHHEYGFPLVEDISDEYDAVIIAVSHNAYRSFDDKYFSSITKPAALIADLKGLFKDKIHSRAYWSL